LAATLWASAAGAQAPDTTRYPDLAGQWIRTETGDLAGEVRIRAQRLTARQGQDLDPAELRARARRWVTESLTLAGPVGDTAPPASASGSDRRGR